MKKVIIPQKNSGTGEITDIQSELFCREVHFFHGENFAFVKSAHYQDDNHQMFFNLIDAQIFAIDSNFCGEIIESDGTRYMPNTGCIGCFSSIDTSQNNKLSIADDVALKIGLTQTNNDYVCFSQNEISNDDLIDLIQDRATGCYCDSLFVFSDGSCINRQDDEYFISQNVDLLDHEYLKSVNYL